MSVHCKFCDELIEVDKEHKCDLFFVKDSYQRYVKASNAMLTSYEDKIKRQNEKLIKSGLEIIECKEEIIKLKKLIKKLRFKRIEMTTK